MASVQVGVRKLYQLSDLKRYFGDGMFSKWLVIIHVCFCFGAAPEPTGCDARRQQILIVRTNNGSRRWVQTVGNRKGVACTISFVPSFSGQNYLKVAR